MADQPTPIDPVTPDAPEGAQPPAADIAPPEAPAEQQDPSQQEWDEAADEMFPNRNKIEAPRPETEESKNVTETTTVASNERSDQSQPEPQFSINDAAREVRKAQQYIQSQINETKNDIRQVMFSDVPTELVDKDGDPIRSVDDVLRLVNPNTGEPFTREEAETWLPQVQSQFAARAAEVDRQSEEIASVNVDLKNEADVVRKRYEEVFKANPDLQQRVWQQYEKTLTIDPKTKVITKAPVSLLDFYETVVTPYVQATTAQTQAAQAQIEADKKVQQVEKKQTQVDRSDIYGNGRPDNRSVAEKEWDEAAKDYYGK